MFDERHYQDPEAAREYLEGILWPEGAVCPHCGCIGNTTKLNLARRQGVHQCNDCRKQFTVMVGTVFERSHIKLHIWFQVVYLLCSSKKGMSSHQIHRMVGVTYKTAWFMTHRIREAMSDDNMLLPPLGGPGETVEVDEAYWGNIRGAEIKRGGSHKNKIVSLVERGGQVRSFRVKRVTSETLRPILAEHVAAQTRLYTDLAPFYGPETNLHKSVNHAAGEYVRGAVHTNTVEGYFGTLKRGLDGIYQHVGSDHLDAYLSEFDFRYNTRDKSDTERTRLALKGIVGKRLTYHDC